MDKVHACWRSMTAPWPQIKMGKDAFWKCEACDFKGDLHDTIGHVVKHQYVVTPTSPYR